MNILILEKSRATYKKGLYEDIETLDMPDLDSRYYNQAMYLDFFILIDGDKMKYLKIRAGDEFPFERGKVYNSTRMVTHLLHINDWYAKRTL